MAPTHFLMLPLITPTSRPQLEQSLSHLRALTQDGDCKVPDPAYRPLGVLHLTLGVMTLTPERLKEALQLLQATDLDALLRWAGARPRTTVSPNTTTATATATAAREAQSPSPLQSLHRPITPLSITLSGLSAFPEARKATVLHARPHDPSDRLYCFALALRQNFIDAGFVAAEERPLVLHATLINTVYARSSGERHGEPGRGVGKVAVDARGWMRQLNGREAVEDERVKREAVEAYVWARGVAVSRVCVCRMGAKEAADQGLGMEYEVVGEKRIDLVEN